MGRLFGGTPPRAVAGGIGADRYSYLDGTHQLAVDLGEPGQLLGQLRERGLVGDFERDCGIPEHGGDPVRLLWFCLHERHSGQNLQLVNF